MPGQAKKATPGLKPDGQANFSPTQRAAVAESSFGYSSAEKAWLKRNWGNEFKFLWAYRLKFQRRQDRAEGRELVRVSWRMIE